MAELSGNVAGCLEPSHKATAWQAASLDMTETLFFTSCA